MVLIIRWTMVNYLLSSVQINKKIFQIKMVLVALLKPAATVLPRQEREDQNKVQLSPFMPLRCRHSPSCILQHPKPDIFNKRLL